MAQQANLTQEPLCVKLVCDISSMFVSYLTLLNVTTFFLKKGRKKSFFKPLLN